MMYMAIARAADRLVSVSAMFALVPVLGLDGAVLGSIVGTCCRG